MGREGDAYEEESGDDECRVVLMRASERERVVVVLDGKIEDEKEKE